MQKEWKYKDPGDPNQVKLLSAALGVDIAIANLLVQRGVTTFDEAKMFFRPKLSDLHDPFLMKDMDKAVDRLHRAIENQEKVLVYGDYDVDGTTSVALMCSFIRKFIKDYEYYIPDRYIEGYGVSSQGIEYAAENNFDLIIVLDCGIKAADKVALANEYGIDFIICDHHNPDDIIPDAVAVLNPKQIDCPYPYKELSGCGVGFKFLHAYCLKHHIPLEVIYDYLDFVVVSIAADIVPITGENRVLAYWGLQKLNSAPSIGLKTIIQNAGISGQELRINDIVFKIGPRLNASGRIEHGNKSVRILLSENAEEASILGSKIDSFNEIRKTLDRDITSEAFKMIENNPEFENQKSTVLYNRDWHKGVVGIVASRLTEHYYRPTIILTESNGLATGSARSVGSFDLYEAIGKCSDLLESYGGHMFAAGLTLRIDKLGEFTRRFNHIVEETLSQKDMVQTIEIDAKVSLSDINPKFVRILKQFEPLGPHNNAPVFVTEDVLDHGTSRLVGKSLEHLKLDLVEPNRSTSVFPGIAFSQGHYFNVIKQAMPFDVCYTITENEFRGKVSTQLNVKDIRSHESL